MDKKQKIQYWLESAEDDWKVSRHLFEKGDYPYSLFFGHLTIEKILKAIYVDRFKKRCTKDFTEKYLRDIQVMREWLLKQIQ